MLQYNKGQPKPKNQLIKMEYTKSYVTRANKHTSNNPEQTEKPTVKTQELRTQSQHMPYT